MAQALAADMLAKGLTPTDMVLLYAWAGEAGCKGLQLKAVSASLLASSLCQGGAQTAGPGAHCLPAPAFTYVPSAH